MFRGNARRRGMLVGVSVLTTAVALILSLFAGSGAVATAAPSATVPQARSDIYVFIPHADDDVLSMGVFITDQIRAGNVVHIVYYTDGAGTGVCSLVNGYCAAHDKFYGESEAQFTAHRDSELYHAVEALGVPESDIEIYVPTATHVRLHDGTVNVPEMLTMLGQYHSMHPTATYLTMSWLDGHPDHGSAGIALRELVDNGTISADQALFSMARWYWAYDYPDRSTGLTGLSENLRAQLGYPLATEMLSCADQECLDRIHAAVAAYGPCPPNTTADQCSGIGYSSVQEYLDQTDQDPRVIIHGAASGKYPTSLDLTSISREAGSSTTADLSGAVDVPNFGTYGTDYHDPKNGDLLVQSLVSSKLTSYFSSGASTTARSLNSSNQVVASTNAALAANGRFTAKLSVPLGVSTVALNSPATTGLLPSSLVLPVQNQSIYIDHTSDLTVRGADVYGGYGRLATVKVHATLYGRALTNALVSLVPEVYGVNRYATTASDGYTTLTSFLTVPQTWLVSTAVPGHAVPTPRAAIRIHSTPANLVVRPAYSVVYRSRGQVALSGALAGRDYPVPTYVLRPAKMLIYFQASGRSAVLVGETYSQQGGKFSATVKVPGAGTLRYEILPVSGAYLQATNAATIRVA